MKLQLTDQQFRDIRLAIKEPLGMSDCALEAGEVTALKPKEPLAADPYFFTARYRATGQAEHQGDVNYATGAVLGLRGKACDVTVEGATCHVKVINVTIDRCDDDQHDDDEFSVVIEFTLTLTLTKP